MRWINCDRNLIPVLAPLMEVVPTANAIIVAEFDNETPIAAAIYDQYNGKSIHSHIWISPGRKPTRQFWFATCDYVFRQCRVETIVAYVSSRNIKSQKLTEHLGYELQSVIPNFYPDGTDALVYVGSPELAFDWRRFKPKFRGKTVTLAA